MNRRGQLALRLIAPIAIGATLANAAPDDRFHGGGHHGYAAAAYSGYTPPSGGDEARFVGDGGFDGYATASFSGYTPPVGGDQARFVGGGSGYDGYAAAGYSGYTQPGSGQLGRFVGGGGFDGYSASVFSGYTPPGGGQLGRFVGGGGFDGYASNAAAMQSNPLDGDSDGDGVPDWWESKHYLSLSLADAQTDIDADGGGSLYEWVADTDPNDPLSKLVLLTLRRGAEIQLDFGTTSENRRYWIETSASALHGDWSPATNPPVSGLGGDMNLSTPDTFGPDALFRIRVAVPE